MLSAFNPHTKKKEERETEPIRWVESSMAIEYVKMGT